MKENNRENELIERIDNINDKYLTITNEMNDNFNNLKDAFYELTNKYELNKMKEKKNEKKIDLKTLNDLTKQLISEEHKNNINYINSFLSKYNSNMCIPSISDQDKIKKSINNIETEIKKRISEFDEEINGIKLENTNNFQSINIEMKNEINNIIKKLNDTSLDLIVSNSDKAKAIQDMIKIFLNKFNISKNKFNEFEDKIIKLISELLDKVILLKKG